MSPSPSITATVAVASAASALVLGLAIAPTASGVPIPIPVPATFNDNACVVRPGYNITRIIDGVRWSLYAWKAYPGQICYSTAWVRR